MEKAFVVIDGVVYINQAVVAQASVGKKEEGALNERAADLWSINVKEEGGRIFFSGFLRS